MAPEDYRIISGHQPAYLPWLGFIHKAMLADVFIYMDDVQYLERDWQNRNQIKVSSDATTWLTIPVDLKGSASRRIADILIKKEQCREEDKWNFRHWRTLQASYGRAPYFSHYREFFESLLLGTQWERLVDINLAILKKIFEWFEIDTELVIGSEQNFSQKKSELILEHARTFNADMVVTGTHGRDYIDTTSFLEKNIKIVFQEYVHPQYPQRFGTFLPNLSFVDLLFNCGPQSREIVLSGNLSRADLCQMLSTK
jgi:hypothetical protein